MRAQGGQAVGESARKSDSERRERQDRRCLHRLEGRARRNLERDDHRVRGGAEAREDRRESGLRQQSGQERA